jgi:bacillithiol biosynthesis deacetylase BshB1
MKVDILAISAHPDDVEVAAGGTLLHHVALGRTVGLLDLTRGELGTRGDACTRTREAMAAAQLLGATVREQLDLPDGFFTADEASLRKIIAQIRRFRPDIILATANEDRHPDHARAAAMIVQATFLANLVRIETEIDGQPQEPWQTRAIYHYIQDRCLRPELVIDITPYIEQKFNSVLAFRSQFYNPESEERDTPISKQSFLEAIRGKNASYGRLIGVDYAEAFTVSRPVGVRDFFDLV